MIINITLYATYDYNTFWIYMEHHSWIHYASAATHTHKQILQSQIKVKYTSEIYNFPTLVFGYL